MGRHWLRLGGHGSVHSPRLLIHCTPCANCTAVHSLMPTCPSLLAAVLRRPTLPRAARRACIPKTSMSTRERRGCMEGALLLLFQLLTGTLLVQLLLSPCKVQDHRSHLAAGMRRALRAAAAAMRLATSPERHAPLPDTIAKHNSMHSGCNKRQHTACYVIKEKRQLQAARRRCVALRCTPGTCTHRFWRKPNFISSVMASLVAHALYRGLARAAERRSLGMLPLWALALLGYWIGKLLSLWSSGRRGARSLEPAAESATAAAAANPAAEPSALLLPGGPASAPVCAVVVPARVVTEQQGARLQRLITRWAAGRPTKGWRQRRRQVPAQLPCNLGLALSAASLCLSLRCAGCACSKTGSQATWC